MGVRGRGVGVRGDGVRVAGDLFRRPVVRRERGDLCSLDLLVSSNGKGESGRQTESPSSKTDDGASSANSEMLPTDEDASSISEGTSREYLFSSIFLGLSPSKTRPCTSLSSGASRIMSSSSGVTPSAKATRFLDDVVLFDDVALGRRRILDGDRPTYDGRNAPDDVEGRGTLDDVGDCRLADDDSAPEDVDGRTPRRRALGDGLGGGDGNQRELGMLSAAFTSARACTSSSGSGVGNGSPSVQSPQPPCGMPGIGHTAGGVRGCLDFF